MIVKFKRWFRDRLITLLARRDYLLVTDLEVDDAAALNFVRSLFDEIQPTLVIDVGGNRGQFRRWIREQVGYTGRGISFEPLQEAAAFLRDQIEGDSKWELQEVALGETQGRAMLNIAGGELADLSTFLLPSAEHTSVLAHVNRIRGQLEVQVETLAQHLPQCKERIYLKLDTQGFDLNVLKGAGRDLERISAVQIELSFTAIYSEQPRASEVIDFLDEHGFTLAGLYRVNRAAFPMRMLEADGYFIRKNLAP